MTKEDFCKVWKDSTKEEILNQYYYDYKEMQELCKRINAIEYIIQHLETIDIWNDFNTSEFLEIIKGEDK